MPEISSSREAGPGSIVLLGASYARGWKVPELAGAAVVNRGVDGEESWQMLARFDADVLGEGPRAVLLWGFINDFFRSPPGELERAAERARRSIREMVERARAAGIEPVLATEVTIRQPAGWTSAARAWLGRIRGKRSYQDLINGHVRAMNGWVRELAVEHGLVLLDFAGVLSDATGVRRPEYASPDGSHLSPAAYEALTAHAREKLQALEKRSAPER